jgi:hypothetical protein
MDRFGATDLIHALSRSYARLLPSFLVGGSLAPSLLSSSTLASALSSSSPVHKQASKQGYISSSSSPPPPPLPPASTKVIDRVLEKRKHHLPLEVLIISL